MGLRIRLRNKISLPDGFKQQDGGAHRYIERVEAAQHRDTDMRIGGLTPYVGQSCRLRTHDDGCATAHVGVVVEMRVLQLCGQDLDASRLEE